VALLPAFVVSSALFGRASVRNMLGSLVRPKGRLVYYLIAMFAFPAIHFIGVVVTNVLHGEAWFPSTDIGSTLAFTVVVSFASVLFFTGGINEESGWRAFGQARLQQRYSPLVANLILWFFLLIWHIPNDIVQYQQGGYLLVRIGLYPFITILLGWIYNRTGGSILAPAIFHASMNSMNSLGEILPMTTAGNIVLVTCALVVVGLDRMWCKLPKAHSAVFRDTPFVATSDLGAKSE
jgi:membrane protease YdiL (CAAX protease family)